MRICIEVKKHRGRPIRLFVDFLRIWYSQEELLQRLETAGPSALLDRDYLVAALRASEEETEDPRIAACKADYERLRKAGDWDGALRVTEEMLAIRPSAFAHVLRGFSLAALVRYEEAIGSFDKALQIDRNNVGASLVRGVVCHGLGRWQEMLESFSRTIEGRPEVADAIAIGVLSVVLRSPLDPETVITWLATCRERLGEPEKLEPVLRFAEVAVRYKAEPDGRILLELPVEERRIVQQMLGIEEKDERE
jgi:tetratricopeptide (TPR) repeat protein